MVYCETKHLAYSKKIDKSTKLLPKRYDTNNITIEDNYCLNIFIDEYLTITDNKSDFITISELYNLYTKTIKDKRVCATRKVFTNKLKNIYKFDSRVKRLPDNKTYRCFVGVKLKILY